MCLCLLHAWVQHNLLVVLQSYNLRLHVEVRWSVLVFGVLCNFEFALHLHCTFVFNGIPISRKLSSFSALTRAQYSI